MAQPKEYVSIHIAIKPEMRDSAHCAVADGIGPAASVVVIFMIVKGFLL
jgi:hypothetical protein